MARNIEIKARVDDFSGLKKRVEQRCQDFETLDQEDLFFASDKGRLKLRILSPVYGQLIYYERSDQTGPKRSDYFVSETNDPRSLKQVLSLALGVRGVVRKRRLVYLIGPTRIHLDLVDGLGDFMELEVVLDPDQSEEQGVAIAAELMGWLGIREGDLVDRAYIDLLENPPIR